MTRNDRPARLNRTLLAVFGVVLLVVGGLVVAAHFDRLPWVDAGSTLVPGTAAPPNWVLWTVVAGVVVLGLLCLRWLLAQMFRMPKPRWWRMETEGSAGRTTLSSATAAAPVAADIAALSAVRAAAAWLSGPLTAPELDLRVTVAADADIGALRHRILDEAVPRLRRALEVDEIAVRLELRIVDADRRRRVQ
ncbi:hypothetical protein [Nocardia paucivorans]|uniref:hypothetical protein n=1 Tax=Nocardia paucivorans TaxID=114259 RepID=UPI00059379DE|nr:hypothetical protein [Nocardia paucivorans]